MIQKNIASITVGTLIFTSGMISHNLLPAQSTTNIDAMEVSVFRQINDYRASKKLPLLMRNSAINRQARIHSQNMANGSVKFGHSGYSQRIKATKISYIAASENVAYNQGSRDPATMAVQMWVRSPGHLKNIRGNYNITGIGAACNSKTQCYITHIFKRI